MRFYKNTKVFVSKDEASLRNAVAKTFCTEAQQAIQEKGRFAVALSGGSTPKLLFQELVKRYRKQVDWSAVDFFWSDERYVPVDHPDSNAGMALQNFLLPLQIQRTSIYSVPTNVSPATQSADAYAEIIAKYFGVSGQPPQFDLILLGVGEDGHTASLFPGTLALLEQKKWVVANWVEKLSAWRITFTYPLLNSAATVLFMVTGRNKAEIVHRILDKKDSDLPAQTVRPFSGRPYWYLDAAAASLLNTDKF